MEFPSQPRVAPPGGRPTSAPRPGAASGDLPRRTLLRGGLLVPVIPVAAAGCTGPSQDKPDPLEPLAESARADARLAEAVAQAHPELSADARTVASVRGEHARRLRREIDRLNPPDPDETSTTPTSTPPPQPPPSADAAGQQLRRRLRSAQDESARVVPTATRYRAGLCGSVSAGCASLLEVLG